MPPLGFCHMNRFTLYRSSARNRIWAYRSVLPPAAADACGTSICTLDLDLNACAERATLIYAFGYHSAAEQAASRAIPFSIYI